MKKNVRVKFQRHVLELEIQKREMYQLFRERRSLWFCGVELFWIQFSSNLFLESPTRKNHKNFYDDSLCLQIFTRHVGLFFFVNYTSSKLSIPINFSLMSMNWYPQKKRENRGEEFSKKILISQPFKFFGKNIQMLVWGFQKIENKWIMVCNFQLWKSKNSRKRKNPWQSLFCSVFLKFYITLSLVFLSLSKLYLWWKDMKKRFWCHNSWIKIFGIFFIQFCF